MHHHGRAIVIAAAAYGGFVALAGLMPSIWLALVLLRVRRRGRHDLGVFRGTVWSQTIPESMRGRLAGIEMLSYSVGPLGGQVRAGFIADLWSVRGAIASGGLACVAGVGLTAAWLRDFWSYDARTDEHAVAERRPRYSAVSPRPGADLSDARVRYPRPPFAAYGGCEWRREPSGPGPGCWPWCPSGGRRGPGGGPRRDGPALTRPASPWWWGGGGRLCRSHALRAQAGQDEVARAAPRSPCSEPTDSGSSRPSPKIAKPKKRISLEAGQPMVAPMARIDPTGTYPVVGCCAERPEVQQRVVAGDFHPISATVTNGTFLTYIQTGTPWGQPLPRHRL